MYLPQSPSRSAALDQGVHVPLMQTLTEVTPWSSLMMQNWVISVEIDSLVMNFIWENRVIFGSVSALKWQQFFYIPQQAQQTI